MPLTERAWHQATLAVKAGRFALRNAVRHASAAYLASVAGCEAACRGLDAHFRPGFRFTSQAAADFNAQVLHAEHFTGTERQQVLSQRLDAATLRWLTSPGSMLHRPMPWGWPLMLLPSACFCGCGSACPLPPLMATAPCAMGWRIASGTMLGHAPAAGTGLRDTTGCATCLHFAVTRLVGVLSLRSPVFSRPAQLMPEAVRRAKVCSRVGRPDLAVTSGMRPGCLPASASDGGRAVRNYESRKRAYQHTEAQCKDQGIQFLPLVFEAWGGGFGPTALGTIRAVSALAAVRTGEPASVVAEKLQQALSVCWQREAARAVLRRLPVSGLRSEAAVAVGEP